MFNRKNVNFKIIAVLAFYSLFKWLSVEAAQLYFNSVKIRPELASLALKPIGLKPVSCEELKPARQRLLEVADSLAKKDFVPYAFGGRKIGSPVVCNACRSCIQNKNLMNHSSSKRLTQCPACKSCSIDCSHFVNQLFSQAKISYRFADTATLYKKNKVELSLKYKLNEISSDVSKALPGDLILEMGHIVMVTAVDVDTGKIDYIHSTRDINNRAMGGIELEKSVPMSRFSRREIMVLRHESLMDPPVVVSKWAFVTDLMQKLKLKFVFNS